MDISCIIAICYVISCSIVILLLSIYTNKLSYTSNTVYIQLFCFLFSIQLSALIHELAHYSQTFQIQNQDYIVVNSNFYIPIIGLVWSNQVFTYATNISNQFLFGCIGFLSQFLYLLCITFIIFKRSIYALFLTCFGFICYLFIYATIMYNSNANDFQYWFSS